MMINQIKISPNALLFPLILKYIHPSILDPDKIQVFSQVSTYYSKRARRPGGKIGRIVYLVRLKKGQKSGLVEERSIGGFRMLELKIILKFQMQVDQNQSHRMPRVSFTETFQSSEAEKEVKFTIDKLIARGIQENNSSLIVEEQPMIETRDVPVLDVCQQTERIALDLRNKYDRTKTASNIIQTKIQKMKEQLQFLKEKQNKLTLLKVQTTEKYIQTESNLLNLQYDIEEAVLSLDVRRDMEERLKKDILYYKKHLFDCTIEQRKKVNDLKRLKNHSHREQRLSLRCKNLLVSVERTVQNNRYQRSKGIEGSDRAVARKREYAMKQLQISRHLQQSMQQALTMKLPEEKQFIKMFLTQKFLKSLLFSKMKALMSSYQEINSAFTAIKQNTSTKTTQNFIQNYLLKDSRYGDLLFSISKAEEKIGILKQESGELKLQQKRLEDQRDRLDQLFKMQQEKEDKDKDIEYLAKLDEKMHVVDQYRNSITLWALCLISMVKKTSKQKIRSKYGNLGDLFVDCLKMLLKIIEEQRQKSISEEQLERSSLNPQDILLRNIRVKTTGDESYREQIDAEYDMESQRDYLQVSRKYVKKRHVFRAKLNSK